MEITIRKSLESKDFKNLMDMQLYGSIEEIVASLESLTKVLDRYNLSFVFLPSSNEKTFTFYDIGFGVYTFSRALHLDE